MDILIQDNIMCLQQGLALLSKLDSEQYVEPNAQCFNSTIGGHIRHNIEHYRSYLAGLDSQSIDYDARLRETRLERSVDYASACHEEVIAGLQSSVSRSLEEGVRVKMDGCLGESPWSQSTFRRELQFLMSHTVHHYALIAVICSPHGIALPEGFGFAPSTLRYQEGGRA